MEQHPGMTEAEAFEAAIAVAHGENVSEGVRAIADVLEGRSLPEVHRRSGLHWVEVWLALLLGGYGMEQRGEFYQRNTIWVRTL